MTGEKSRLPGSPPLGPPRPHSPAASFNPADLQTDISGCARCGMDHPALKFSKLTRSMMIDRSMIFTYWAKCPKNGEPILLRITADAN